MDLGSGAFLASFRPVEFSTPVAVPHASALIAGAASGRLVRVRADGVVQWRTELPGGVQSRPLLDPSGQTIFVASDDAGLLRLDANTGRQLWRHPLKTVLRSAPVIDGARVYFSTEDETLTAADRETGKWVWSHHREAPEDFTITGIPAPVLVAGLVIAGYADGVLVGLQPESGAVRWTRQLVAPGTQFADVDGLLAADGRLFVASFAGGLFEVAPGTGEVIWHQPQVQGVSVLHAELPDLLLAGTGAGALLRLNPGDGQPLWRRQFGQGAVRGLAVKNGTILLASQGLGLLLLRQEDGSPGPRLDPGRGIGGGVTLLDDKLFFLSNGGYLYAMSFP